MKRMHVTLDEEALEDARRLTGKKSYSDTLNHLIIQAVKQDKLVEAIDALAKGPDPWWPGYVEEMAPDVAEYLKQQKQQKRVRRTAANTARAPIAKTARRGSR
jgi:DNA-binding NarL/FixJ family response regulator